MKPDQHVGLRSLPLRSLLAKGAERGLHEAAQVEVAASGRPVIRESFGVGAAGGEVTAETQFPWTCNSKIVGSLAVATLVSANALDFGAPLAGIFPEAAASGLAQRTVADVLMHRTGVTADHGDRLPQLGPQRVLRTIIEDTPWSGPGATPPHYRLWAHWFIVSELVRRITGMAYEDYVTHHVLGPLDTNRSCLNLASTDPGDHVRFQVGRGDEARYLHYDDKPYADVCLAGTSFFGSMRDLCRLLQPLADPRRTLHGRQSARAEPLGLSDTARSALVEPRRRGEFDEGLSWDPSWSLGLMTDRRGFPGYTGGRLVGHHGLGSSSIALVDRERDVTIAIAFDRAPGRLESLVRTTLLLRAITDELVDRALIGSDQDRAPIYS